jgi:hypothetical protein
VDVAWAFNLVSWPFLLQIMQAVGFSSVWCDWVSALFSSASTKVMLNGAPGERVCHARGLRQGDPLSPKLFLLIMEVLSAMFKHADDWSLLQPLGARPIPYCISLYVDDMVLFTAPRHQDLQLARDILQVFEGASGLGCNMVKCQLALIRCSEEQTDLAVTIFSCQKVDFPIKYLGLPLSTRKLLRSALQPLADRITDKLPSPYASRRNRSPWEL